MGGISMGRSGQKTNVRYTILVFIGAATPVNFIDRATLSVTAPLMSKELRFDTVTMGR